MPNTEYLKEQHYREFRQVASTEMRIRHRGDNIFFSKVYMFTSILLYIFGLSFKLDDVQLLSVCNNIFIIATIVSYGINKYVNEKEIIV